MKNNRTDFEYLPKIQATDNVFRILFNQLEPGERIVDPEIEELENLTATEKFKLRLAQLFVTFGYTEKDEIQIRWLNDQIIVSDDKFKMNILSVNELQDSYNAHHLKYQYVTPTLVKTAIRTDHNLTLSSIEEKDRSINITIENMGTNINFKNKQLDVTIFLHHFLNFREPELRELMDCIESSNIVTLYANINNCFFFNLNDEQFYLSINNLETNETYSLNFNFTKENKRAIELFAKIDGKTIEHDQHKTIIYDESSSLYIDDFNFMKDSVNPITITAEESQKDPNILIRQEFQKLLASMEEKENIRK